MSYDDLAERFNGTIPRDFLDTFIRPELIGRGIAREVYAVRHIKGLVCKIELEAGSFQNVMEFNIWDELQHTEHAKWLAPVEFISACGTIILQARTEPLTHSKYPAKIPSWLTDTKYQNFGLLNGKFVCHDYGSLIVTNGVNKRMVKADWWDD